MNVRKIPKSESYFAMELTSPEMGFLSWKRWLLGSATKMETQKLCQKKIFFFLPASITFHSSSSVILFINLEVSYVFTLFSGCIGSNCSMYKVHRAPAVGCLCFLFLFHINMSRYISLSVLVYRHLYSIQCFLVELLCTCLCICK